MHSANVDVKYGFFWLFEVEYDYLCKIAESVIVVPDSVKKYEYVFVILTYKNHTDLEEYLPNIAGKVSDYKVIVVNAFCDEATEERIQKIAIANDCDFISVENRGYGYGNNRGIEYAMAHYSFDYLIISNPDILIRDFNPDREKYKDKSVIIAPEIVTKKGKNQNPYWAVKFGFTEWLIYTGYRKKSNLIKFSGIIINKFIREMFLLFHRKRDKKVFAAHGSFVIFSSKALEQLVPVYDENMFLFAEEALLAHICRQKKIPIIFSRSVHVDHKEDGSISVAKINDGDILRTSVMYYYEKIKRNKG